uniref:SEC7 domain-containing protein n=1 Tax=Syphacia muris TaxID=451379 RepID=A0A0N5ARG8_9BILA
MVVDEQNSSVAVNVGGGEQCSVDSTPTVSSSSLQSSHCSLPSVNPSPMMKRRILDIEAQSGSPSRSEPTTPAKVTTSTDRNHITIVPCPSPLTDQDKAESGADAAVRLARRLFALDGFKKTDVASHLSKNNEFGRMVSEEYCAAFNFSGIRLDAALRDFLSRFCLIGESQERTRIIEHFATRYFQCNPTLFSSPDQVHALTCALLLLNSDLHGENAGKRMSSREFIENLGETEYVFDRGLLKTLYMAIKDQPIKWAEDDNEDSNTCKTSTGGTLTSSGKNVRKSMRKSRSTIGEDDQIEYKVGWVVMKCVYDSDGKRTPFGRRGWHMRYARVRGMILYIHKDDVGFSRGRYETYKNLILLHHSVAERPKDYSKRQHVFRLRTANKGEYLFQTSEPSEVQKWIDAINYVAAAFSSPALPLSVSSDISVFNRPLLPSTPSKLSIAEQLRAHEEKESEMRQLIDELMMQAPPLNSKRGPVYNYFYKERYLFQERERYELYTNVLRRHLNALSPSNSMAIRIENGSVASCSRVEIPRSSSVVHPRTPAYCTEVVLEEPEAEARAEAADRKAVGLKDSDDKISYKEAISKSPAVGATGDTKFHE